MESLKGKKTYIIAMLLGLVGLMKALTGDASGMVEIFQNVDLILESAGLASLRAGITSMAAAAIAGGKK